MFLCFDWRVFLTRRQQGPQRRLPLITATCCVLNHLELAQLYRVDFLEMLRKWAREFGYHPNDIISLLREAGYRCWGVGHDGIREIAEVIESTTETNYIFLHASHAREIAGAESGSMSAKKPLPAWR